MRLIILIILTSLITGMLKAQRPGAGSSNISRYSNPNNINFASDSLSAYLDSILPPFQYLYYHLDQFDRPMVMADTTLDNEFKESEPGRRKTFYDINTGNAGSATTPVILNYLPIAGFHSGYDAYRSYNIELSKFRFFDSERTLADLKFAMILGSQNNFIVGADFGEKFKSGISMSLNYQRVSQLGSYNGQETKSTHLGLAFRLETLKKRLNIFTGILSNTNNEQNNGGLVDPDKIDDYQFKTSVPVFLDDANTRFDYKDVFLHARYDLAGSETSKSQFSLGYHFQYHYGYNRFSDPKVDNDSSFYRYFWQGSRGIRNFNDISKVTNEVYIKTALSWVGLRAGLAYDRINVEQDSRSFLINDVTLKLNGLIRVKKSVDIDANAMIGLGNNAGTFTLDGTSTIHLGKWLNIDGKLSFFRSQLPWRHNYLRINDQDVYNNDFKKPFGSAVDLGLEINPLNLRVSAGQKLINDYLYFDTISRPVQWDGLFSTNYLAASQKLRLWKLGFENDILLQQFSESIVALPGKMLRSNLFLENLIFHKNLLLRVGVEVRYLPDFEVPAFNPVLGNFYKTNGVTKDDYLFGDIYILGQIAKKFRILVKWENAQAMFTTKTNYLALGHPQFDTYIKLGFRWLLLD